ncbi:BamA/TamA family outer membrane protein [Sediminibacterium sp. WSJ-3]|nr:BamA/TamA family outer membrane protein [Sediminibacterium soli]
MAQPDSAKKTKLLILPVISKSVETGWAFGTASSFTFRIFPDDTGSRTSSMQALALYSTKKQLVMAINGAQYFRKEKYILNEQFSYSSFPDKFWGLGKQTPVTAEEPYRFQQYYVYAHLMRKVARHLFAGIIFENQKVWNIEYLSGGAFDKQDVQGRKGYKIAGFGGSFTYDSRNNAFSPDKGFFGQLFIDHFDAIWGSDYNYTNILVDLRKYLSLTKKQVLAFQLYSFNNTGREVPIRSLAALGGASRMRGFYEGRYRDINQLVLQGEYRLHVKGRFGLALFAGTGSVAANWREYALDDLRHSMGAGLRVALDKKEKLNLRIDYGTGGGKNNGLYLQIGEAF